MAQRYYQFFNPHFQFYCFFNAQLHLSVCFQKHLFLHPSLHHIAYTQIFVQAFEILVLICVCFNVHDFISPITILHTGSVFYRTCKHHVSVTLCNSNQKNLKEQIQEGNVYFGLWCQRVRFTVAWLSVCAQSILETGLRWRKEVFYLMEGREWTPVE